eukprot:2282593-Rhodomonas_salina.1
MGAGSPVWGEAWSANLCLLRSCVGSAICVSQTPRCSVDTDDGFDWGQISSHTPRQTSARTPSTGSHLATTIEPSSLAHTTAGTSKRLRSGQFDPDFISSGWAV